MLGRSRLQKNVLGCSPGEDGFCKLQTKYNLQNGVKTKIVCFCKKIARTKSTNLKESPGLKSW
jgi:hypothetical protein